jgi:hypothetical protein
MINNGNCSMAFLKILRPTFREVRRCFEGQALPTHVSEATIA